MKLSKFINKFIFSIAFICTTVVFFVSIFFQYMSYKKDIQHIKKEFIQYKKNELIKEIQIIYNLVDQNNSTLEKLTKNLPANSDIKEIERVNKNNILDLLASYLVGKDGYIYVNTLDGKALIWDGKRLDTPIEHPDKELLQKQIDSTKKDGFLFYKFKKPDTMEKYEKIAFVKEYEKYGWIIGTGAYLDEIEIELTRKEAIFRKSIENQIMSLFTIFILILIVIYIISKKLSKYIKINIQNLTSSFEQAAKASVKINTNDLTFKEFISLANNLNSVLENKNYTKKKLQDYINIVNENIIISSTDKQGIITDVSEAFCKISGYKKEELIGQTHRLIRHPETPDSFYKNMWDTLFSKKEWKGEIKNKDKNGQDYWVLAVITPTLKNDEIIGFTAIRTNITDKKHIEYLSITDELTQLYNRRFFNIKIEKEINRAKRENSYLSFLIIDVDYFKDYNDSYGHQKGDLALQEVANILKKYTNRSSDFAFRLGGEEFGIITRLDKEKIIEFSNNIKNDIEELHINHNKSSISKYLTISIGITSKIGFDLLDTNTLYKEADDALYSAKNNGRNCIFIQE
ncbi:diguanylate cyclase [Arcobacter sp. s6]|uniref:diguanylate cyclase n=1 Tax=Arcobacter sp. s6 TaxID=3230363 RepID=UPI0034A01307